MVVAFIELYMQKTLHLQIKVAQKGGISLPLSTWTNTCTRTFSNNVCYIYRACDEGSLNSTLAKGKFVLCFQVRGQRQSSEAALTVYNAGGIGVIYAQIPTKTIVCSSLIPCVQVDFEAGTKILSYLQSSR